MKSRGRRIRGVRIGSVLSLHNLVGMAVLIVAFVMITTLPAQPQEKTKQPEVIKLGIVTALTGVRAIYGSYANGALAMVDYINKTGGIKSMGGAKIQVLMGDDASDTATFGMEIERVIKQGAVAVFTLDGSAAQAAGAPLADKYKIPIMNNMAVAGATFEMNLKYWRSIYIRRSRVDELYWASGLIDYLIKDQKFPNPHIALAYGDIDYLQHDKKIATAQLKQQGYYDKYVVYDKDFSYKLTDFTSVLAKIKAANPNIIQVLPIQSGVNYQWQSQYNLNMYYPHYKAAFITDINVTQGEFMNLLGWEKYKAMFIDKPVFIMSAGNLEMNYKPMIEVDKIIRPYYAAKSLTPMSVDYKSAQAIILFRRAWETLGTTDAARVNDYLTNLELKYGDPDMVSADFYPKLAWESWGEPKHTIMGYEQLRSCAQGYDATTASNLRRVEIWPKIWNPDNKAPILP